jgi:type I restriction-modification system DNA methylase subunit
MSDERITSSKEAVIAEILGDVSKLEDQVKAIHAELVDSNKKMKEQYENSKQALFLSRTEALESIRKEAAKLVRDGVFSETNNLKRTLEGLILKINREAEELNGRMRRTYLSYVFLSSFGVALATLFIEKVILTH